MKKLLLSVVMILSFNGLSAYIIGIKNKAPRTIQYRARLAACKTSPWIEILPGSTYKEQVLGCCLKKAEVRYFPSSVFTQSEQGTYTPQVRQVITSGKKYSAKGKNTGFGISCRSNTFVVTQKDNGELKVKRD